MCTDRKSERAQARFIVFADDKTHAISLTQKGFTYWRVMWAVGAQAVSLLPLPSPFFLFSSDTCPPQLEFIYCVDTGCF